ncbi:hypothetical protein BLOT_007964 [Blomia tropicalis]|nr:hypothetical protein BLOT_007964 [Blomia tropicalis]
MLNVFKSARYWLIAFNKIGYHKKMTFPITFTSAMLPKLNTNDQHNSNDVNDGLPELFDEIIFPAINVVVVVVVLRPNEFGD